MNNPIKPQQKASTSNTEEGMAMLITMMVGLLLLAGSGGLMARMMMGRKIGSSESYQQMAETAALNGFNRILFKYNRRAHLVGLLLFFLGIKKAS